MSSPARIVTDDDEIELPELASTADEAQALAIANRLLLQVRAIDRKVALKTRELELTVANFEAVAKMETDRLEIQRKQVENALRVIYTSFPPTDKKKSRRLLAGVIGTREKGGRITLANKTAALKAAKIFCPDAVKQETVDVLDTEVFEGWAAGQCKMPAAEGDLELPLEAEMRDVPLGLRWTPKADEFYAKPSDP